MIKEAGAIVAAVACIGISLYKVREQSKRVDFIEKAISFICILISEIRFSALSSVDIIEKHKDKSHLFAVCFDNLECGMEFYEAFKKAVSKSKIKNPEKEIIEGLGESFGQSDSDGEISLLELGSERLKDVLGEAKEEKAIGAKLYPVLGLSAGAVFMLFCL